MAGRVRLAAVFVAGIAIIVVPITVRNAIVGGDFVPLTSNAGLNLYIGNHEASMGAYVKPEGLDVYTDPEGETIAEADVGRGLKPSQVSNWWARRAWAFIAENPDRFAANLLRKAFFFWSVYEVPQIEHLAFEKRYSALLRIPSPSFGIVCPLGIIGIILSVRRRKPAQLMLLYILTYSATIIAFFVVARYRLPMLPALMVFAGFSIWWLVYAGTQGRFKRLALAVIGIAVLAIVVNTNFYGIDPRSGYAQSYYRLGIIHGLNGRPAEALSSYRKALELDPDIVPARVSAGILLSQAGQHAEAKRELQRSIELDPTYEKAHYNLGLVYSEQAKLDSALLMMDRALELKPDYTLAMMGKAALLYEMGRFDDAGPLLTAVGDHPSAPENVRAQAGLLLEFLPLRKSYMESRRRENQRASDAHLLRGDIMVSLRMLDRAMAEYEAAIELDPRSAAADYQVGSVFFTLGDLDRALAGLERALRADPDYPGANSAAGIIYIRKQDFERACRAFEAELRANPHSAEAHMNLAMCYERYLLNIEKALYHLEKYVEITGGNPQIRSHIAELKARAEKEEDEGDD